MNEANFQYSMEGTATNVGLLMNDSVPQAVWPVLERPSYTVSGTSSSFSAFDSVLARADMRGRDDFTSAIAAVYATLLSRQEPLGADFETVWDSNTDELYQP